MQTNFYSPRLLAAAAAEGYFSCVHSESFSKSICQMLPATNGEKANFSKFV